MLLTEMETANGAKTVITQTYRLSADYLGLFFHF